MRNIFYLQGTQPHPSSNKITRSFHEEKAENALLRRALDVAEAEVAEAEAEVGGIQVGEKNRRCSISLVVKPDFWNKISV